MTAQIVTNKDMTAGFAVEPANGMAEFQVLLQTQSPIDRSFSTTIAHFSYSELKKIQAAIQTVIEAGA